MPSRRSSSAGSRIGLPYRLPFGWPSSLPVSPVSSSSTAPATRPSSRPPSAEKVLQDEEGVGGAFGQPAHQVGIPLGAEGNVDAASPAFFDQLLLQITADAVE